MIAGLILMNATMTARYAAGQTQAGGEGVEASGLSSSIGERPQPQPNIGGGKWGIQDEAFQRKESPLESLGKRLIFDQREIWSSPARLRWTDAEWLVPVAGITTGMILTDASVSRSLPGSPHTLHLENELRTGSVAALGAAAGGMYLWSLRTHEPHQRETGLLAGEAMIDSLMLTEGVKFAAGRERPQQGNGQGNFFRGRDSFPSGHSATAWAAAGILAHEYPGPMTKLLAYGLATTVSLASEGSKQHFSSDVLIGSGMGWLVSEYVYRTHHDVQVGGSAWNPIGALGRGESSGQVENPGAPYVPLDSWVYAAFDRLAALGYVSSGFQGTRPWSRAQCLHLLEEAEEEFGVASGLKRSVGEEARALISGLQREFGREELNLSGTNNSAEVDAMYTRVMSASGTVLNNGYHFGQTISYDFGRPSREGTNLISGGSASATHGSLFFYVSGEYQHGPSAPALTPAEIQFIANRDETAPSPPTPSAAINQFQFLDAYAGTNFRGWQISFGNQSLSWGPGIGGSLLLSNNAAPFPMLRIAPEDGVEIPGLSRIFGPFHLEQFYGQISGYPGARQPWIYGQKVSLKPFHSLEFAYGRTTLIGGPRQPLNTQLFVESLFGKVNAAEKSVPGDSRTAVEWTWRLPKMHDCATFYGELEDDDDPIPLQNVAKSLWRPGIYFPRLPWLAKWDAHFEWTSSTSPGRGPLQSHGELNYWNLDYASGYTNDGNLLGNTVGREGITLQGWVRYWMGPRKTLDFSWKQSRVLGDYVPGGGKWQDYQASYAWTGRTGLYGKSLLQFEHIASFPLLFAGSRNNVVASVEIGIYPQWGRQQNSAGSMSSARAGAESPEAPR
jgi:Capsule assembly protein Wzi/PAP2 superfamily